MITLHFEDWFQIFYFIGLFKNHSNGFSGILMAVHASEICRSFNCLSDTWATRDRHQIPYIAYVHSNLVPNSMYAGLEWYLCCSEILLVTKQEGASYHPKVYEKHKCWKTTPKNSCTGCAITYISRVLKPLNIILKFLLETS